MKKTISLILAAILLAAAIAPASAERRTNYAPPPEAKTYCEATLDDDFADDRVLVVFNNETSRKFHTFTPVDFPEIDCARVDDRTLIYAGIYNGESLPDNYRPGDWLIGEYHQTVLITLAVPGKQNVLDAIRLLERRDDVLAAEPDYICFVEEEPRYNARDVIDLMRRLLDGASAAEYPAGDINSDGKLNSRDVTAMMKLILED